MFPEYFNGILIKIVDRKYIGDIQLQINVDEWRLIFININFKIAK